MADDVAGGVDSSGGGRVPVAVGAWSKVCSIPACVARGLCCRESTRRETLVTKARLRRDRALYGAPKRANGVMLGRTTSTPMMHRRTIRWTRPRDGIDGRPPHNPRLSKTIDPCSRVQAGTRCGLIGWKLVALRPQKFRGDSMRLWHLPAVGTIYVLHLDASPGETRGPPCSCIGIARHFQVVLTRADRSLVSKTRYCLEGGSADSYSAKSCSGERTNLQGMLFCQCTCFSRDPCYERIFDLALNRPEYLGGCWAKYRCNGSFLFLCSVL